MAARVEVDPSTILGDIDLSDTDRAELQRPERMQIIRESFTEQAATGVDGWVDDDLATVAPWGFDVGQITVPVLVRYGATDVLVPPAHGEWLATNVPGCIVKVDDDAGHLGSDPVQEITEHMTWLRDGVAPADSRPPGRVRE
jgi:pimeloyl-ACP methyl ester carboxylesterase